MSLDKITLSPVVVEKLYKTSLVADVSAPAAKPAKQKKAKADEDVAKATGAIKFLGKNAKNILIIVDEKDHAFLSDDDLNFLLTVLNACNITLEDAALINSSSHEDLSNEMLNAQFSPNVLLFFGTEPETFGFPIKIPMYRVQQYNKQQYLCGPSLAALSADKEAKKAIWPSLKSIFTIG